MRSERGCRWNDLSTTWPNIPCLNGRDPLYVRRSRPAAAPAFCLHGRMGTRRFVVPFFAVAGLALLPWTFFLTQRLPSHHTDEHWRALWVGFDLALATAMFGTAFLAVRRSPWLEVAAAITGTLLLCDAWFDSLLESGNGFVLALIEAGAVELPLAGICFWIARDAERFFARADVPRSR